MDDESHQRPTVLEEISGWLFLSGCMGILASPLLGTWLALESLPDGWNWTWFAIVGSAITATIVTYCSLLIFIARFGIREKKVQSATDQHLMTRHPPGE